MAEDDNELKRRYMRWSGELQEAYLEALEECGGLNEARPKALLDLLLPRFPFLTLQESLGPAVTAGAAVWAVQQLCDWCRCRPRSPPLDSRPTSSCIFGPTHLSVGFAECEEPPAEAADQGI
jgi:hypothetical protein